MKKLLAVLSALTLFISLSAETPKQTYTYQEKAVVGKEKTEGDVVRKVTKISVNGGIVTISETGKPQQVLYVMYEESSRGSKEHYVNLDNGEYGYQTVSLVIRKEDNKAFEQSIYDDDQNRYEKYGYRFIHRVVVDKKTKQTEKEIMAVGAMDGTAMIYIAHK